MKLLVQILSFWYVNSIYPAIMFNTYFNIISDVGKNFVTERRSTNQELLGLDYKEAPTLSSQKMLSEIRNTVLSHLYQRFVST